MYRVSRSWNSPSFSGIAICTTMRIATNTICNPKAVAKASNFLLFLCGIVSGNSSNMATMLDGGGENPGQTGDYPIFLEPQKNRVITGLTRIFSPSPGRGETSRGCADF